MNAVIKPQPCPCCAIKDKNIEQYEVAVQVGQEVVAMQAAKIEELQMAFTREVSRLVGEVAARDDIIKQQEKILEFADARHNRLVDSMKPPAVDRRQFRGAWAREKVAAVINGASK